MATNITVYRVPREISDEIEVAYVDIFRKKVPKNDLIAQEFFQLILENKDEIIKLVAERKNAANKAA